MDDAQKRAQAFNDQQRIAELEDLLAKERLGSAVERKAISELEKELADVKAALQVLAEELGKSDLDALQIIAARKAEIAALNDLAERTSKIHRKTTKELKQSLRVLLAHAEGKRKITTAHLLRAGWRLREPGEASKTLQQMRDDAVRTGLDKALDVTPDDVVALQRADAWQLEQALATWQREGKGRTVSKRVIKRIVSGAKKAPKKRMKR